jgi:hypothetical protein
MFVLKVKKNKNNNITYKIKGIIIINNNNNNIIIK